MEGKEWRFALTISGAHGMDHFLKRVFPPLIPVWAFVFGFPLWQLGVILGARSFGSAIGQAPMGHLSDRFDRRFMLPTGIAAMGCSFIVFAIIPTLEALAFEFDFAGVTLSGQFLGMLIVMVAIGLGSSTLHPTGYPLISQNVTTSRKGKVLGMWGSARAFGDGTAPAVVGVALLITGWQWILVGFGVFGVLYAIYLFTVLGGYETIPADTDETQTPATEQASIWDADRRLYVYPMLAVFVAFALQIMATTGVTVFLPQFITSEYGYSFTLAGYLITPESTASFYYSALLITAGIVQLGTGELIDRYDHRKVLIAFLVVGTGMLVSLAVLSFPPSGLFGVLILLGASLWALNPARDAIVSDISPPHREGRTFGYLWTGALLVASTAPAVVGYIGDIAGLRQAFLAVAGLVLLSAIPIALLLTEAVYLESGQTGPVGAD